MSSKLILLKVVLLCNKFQEAYDAGITLITSAGQDVSGPIASIFYPAQFSAIIAVGGITQDKSVYQYGNYGAEMEIVAPVNNLKVTTKTNTVRTDEGTSYSGAFLTGIFALMKELDTQLVPQRFRLLLSRTALDLNETGRDVYTGFGLVQAQFLGNAITDQTAPVLQDYLLTVDNTTSPPILTLDLSFLEMAGLLSCSLVYQQWRNSGLVWTNKTPCTPDPFPFFTRETSDQINLSISLSLRIAVFRFSVSATDIEGRLYSSSLITINTGLSDPDSSTEVPSIVSTTTTDMQNTQTTSLPVQTSEIISYATERPIPQSSTNSKISSANFSFNFIFIFLFVLMGCPIKRKR